MQRTDEFIKAMQSGMGMAGVFASQSQQLRQQRSAEELKLLQLGRNEGYQQTF